MFYLFSQGGPFYYDGFGVGSLWFAALVAQNSAYYLIAGLFIPLGLGNFTLRRWAWTLSMLWLWLWIGAGAVLLLNLFILVPGLVQRASSAQTAVMNLLTGGAFLVACFLIGPLILLRFYGSRKVNAVYTQHDAGPSWIEKIPFPLLLLLCLMALFVLLLHFAIFLQGLLPYFGTLRFGRGPVPVLALSIVVLLGLMVGLFRQHRWAWWGTLIVLSLFTISSLTTFMAFDFYDIVQMKDVPAHELELIAEATFMHNYNLLTFLAIPLLASLGLTAYSRRFF